MKPDLDTIDGSVYYDLPAIALDCETTNLKHGNSLVEDNRLLLTCAYQEATGNMSTVWADQYNVPEKLLDATEGRVVLVGHNLKFDIRWLARAGLDLSKILIWDTQLAEKVLLGNNPKYLPLALDAVAERYGLGNKTGMVGKLIKGGVCPSDIPRPWLAHYCRQDVKLAYSIYLAQKELIREQGLEGVVLTRCMLTPVLADIEANGMNLDADRVNRAYNRATKALSKVEVMLHKIAPINWGSSKQKGEFIYGQYKFPELRDNFKRVRKTPKGNPLTGITDILQLKATNKRQKLLIRLLKARSKYDAQVSKNLSQFKACVDDGNLFHAEFRQDVTKTHRLSSTGTEYSAQGQNIPRTMKKLFCAPKDWMIAECDGANLEFRGAVELGDDEQGRIDIANVDFDAHTITAEALTANGQPTGRQDAKSRTFKPLYAGESGTEAEQAYFAVFKARYPGIAAVQEKWMAEALATKKVRLDWGLTFHFPYTKINNKGYQLDKTNICNYPVQSFATAEIIPIAIINLWHSMKALGLKGYIINTVHDSVIVVAPKEEIEIINELFIVHFTNSCYNYLKRVYKMDFKTPLGVGIKWGSNWGFGDEMKVDVDPVTLNRTER